MSALSFPSSNVVRGFVIFGAAAAVFSTIVIWRLVDTRQNELLRYQACKQGTRKDCQPSLFWVLAGLAKPDAQGAFKTAIETDENKKRVNRTSDNAPILTSLRPEGFSPEGAGYRVETGKEVDLISTIENAKRVEVRFRPKGETESVVIKAMDAVKDKENTFEAKFVWTETRSGDLEIRAYGDPEKEQTSLLVPLTVAVVAKTK